MHSFLKDPVVLICSGIILVGFFGLVWAISQFRQKKSKSGAKAPHDVVALAVSELKVQGLNKPAETPTPPGHPEPALSKDVADRLESMTQRLTEMQSALLKHPPAGSGDSGATPSVGQGFSPDTIDKFLKIIGNVIQQVDVLQKSLGTTKEGSGAKPEPPGTKV